MSYLDIPRIGFQGTFTAAGPTRNNLLAALDQIIDPSKEPPWDYNPTATGGFSLTASSSPAQGASTSSSDACRVRLAWDQSGRSHDESTGDPLFQATISGSGRMADLDPENRRVTDLAGFQLTISLPAPASGGSGPSVSGVLGLTQIRDFWTNQDASVNVYMVASVWQSVLEGVTWDGDIGQSPLLKQLQNASPDRLSVKMTLREYDGTGGKVIGVIGPYRRGEPRQFVAARRLLTQRPTGQLPFPVASFLVNPAQSKLVVDLSNLIPDPNTPANGPLITQLTATVLSQGAQSGSIGTPIGPQRDVNLQQWAQSSGIVEWDLTPPQLQLLDSQRLGLTFQQGSMPLTMEEHPSGKYVDVDCRSLRLNPGESARLGVYARHLGKPLGGEVVSFGLHQQTARAAVATIVSPGEFGYPADPSALINSEPAEVIVGRSPGLSVTTGPDGYAELTVAARPGTIALPPLRTAIDSQLYFLGDPEGWQSWGALGANNGPVDLSDGSVAAGCALSVLVFNTHPPIANPTWADLAVWLKRYARLYPGMTAILDLGQEGTVSFPANAAAIYKALNCLDFNDANYMPVTRDLSNFQRQTILAYLRTKITGRLPC